MRNNKGFTLIELLAVIVILAIIALIATPIILGIINDSRKSAARESAKLVAKTFESAHAHAYMVKAGEQPTLYELCDYFNMDNAKCTKVADDTNGNSKVEVTVDIENIICEVTSVPKATSDNKEFSTTEIKCYETDDGSSEIDHTKPIAESPTVTVRKIK